jgi:hypothetical protein
MHRVLSLLLQLLHQELGDRLNPILLVTDSELGGSTATYLLVDPSEHILHKGRHTSPDSVRVSVRM